MTTQVRAWLDNSILQPVAESYLDKSIERGGTFALDVVLKQGVNHPELNLNGEGATRLTKTQIAWFVDNYEIITHYPNDVSGFSATLFRNKSSGEFTLSFRSTEYQLSDKGGDWGRDGASGADGAIKDAGLALAQLSSMENFYERLKNGAYFGYPGIFTGTQGEDAIYGNERMAA